MKQKYRKYTATYMYHLEHTVRNTHRKPKNPREIVKGFYWGLHKELAEHKLKEW